MANTLPNNFMSSFVTMSGASVSLFARGAAVDSVWRGKEDYYKRYQPALELASLSFPDPSTIVQVATLIAAVSTYCPWYDLKPACCYWYARSICEHAEVLFQGQRTALKNELKQTTWKNVPYVAYKPGVLPA